MLLLELAIFTLKFKFLGTIALNLGLLQLKALKFPFNFFQVKALKVLNHSTFFKSRPWKPESFNFFQPKETLKKPEVNCSAICIIHFSDAYIVHLLSNSKFYGCIPTYSIKCILQNWNASCLHGLCRKVKLHHSIL